MERHGQAPAISFLAALTGTWSRLLQKIAEPDSSTMYGQDVAWSDNLERELIERELHPR